MTEHISTTGYGRPEASLGSYAIITLVFVLMNIFFFWLIFTFGWNLPRISLSDMVLLGIATHKISWLVSFDAVLSFLRAPFTRFQSWMAPGAVVHEQARGTGMRFAIGELLACPWCMGLWFAALFVFGFIIAPATTRTIATILAVLMMADVLQVLYLLLGKVNTKAAGWAEG